MPNTVLLFSVRCVDWAGFQVIEKYVYPDDLQCHVFLVCTKVKRNCSDSTENIYNKGARRKRGIELGVACRFACSLVCKN